MPFGEKLASLRKQSGMTQQQLAEKLFVSRTAVSKWESDKGFPSIDSLKNIAELFGVSVDSLLSGDELINLASAENRGNIAKTNGFVCALIDIFSAAFIFLPIYGEESGGKLVSVSLIELSDPYGFIKPVYLSFLNALCLLGAAEMIIHFFGGEKAVRIGKTCSVVLHSAAVLLCSLSHQPYITAFLFLFLLMKFFVFLRGRNPR